MNATIVVNDLETNRRIMSVLDENEFRVVEREWANEDKILVEMQGNPFFSGRRRWCDLDPTHYRVMILNNMTIVAAMSDEERANPGNAPLRSLFFLLAALVYCLQTRTESMIEFLRINRLNATEAVFDYNASLNMHVDLPRPSPGEFRVVVDNETP